MQRSSDAAPARCPRCKGAGYLRANVPFGHPQFGKAVECECKKAQKKEARRRQLWEQSKIDQQVDFCQATFETFQFWQDGVGEAYEAAEAFASSRFGWLVLAGRNGCGKTHLAVAIAKRCLDNGQEVLFATVPDLLDDLRATFSPDAEETYDREFRKMREVEVLILDELGAESSTSWAREKLYQLFNHRYTRRLSTVITTNCVNLEEFPARISSRLGDCSIVRTVIMQNALDFRKLKGKKV